MEENILMIFLGIVASLLMYRDIKKGNISDFTLIQAWGVMIIGIMIIIIGIIKLVFGIY